LDIKKIGRIIKGKNRQKLPILSPLITNQLSAKLFHNEIIPFNRVENIIKEK